MTANKKHFDVGILQPGYLPWLGYFDLACLSDVFVLYDDVQFDRGGWRNRNRLLGRDGHQWISVPVLKKGYAYKKINEIRVLDNSWPQKHVKTIRTLYSRAPFFDWCFPIVERYLSQKSYGWLLDLCLEGHRYLASLVEISSTLKLSSDIGYEGLGRTERLVAICQAFKATRYIATDASASYMNESLWDKAGIELVYQSYPHPQYKQFSKEFVSHLSIIDALMFVGPKTREFLGISHPKEI